MSDYYFSNQARKVWSWSSKIQDVKHSNVLIGDYKILLTVCLLWGLPYAPCQLLRESYTTNILLTTVCFLYTVCKISVSIGCLCYMKRVLPSTPSALCYNAFIIFGFLVNIYLFFKREKIIKAARMVIDVMEQVSPRKFKSKWNVLGFAVSDIIVVLTVSSTVLQISSKSFDLLRGTSISFLWYEFENEDASMFVDVLSFAAAASFVNCIGICGVAVILSTTVYFHLGDIITNFGVKLEKRLEYQNTNRYSFCENLYMFQRITGLNTAIHDAFASIVLLLYGSIMGCFFTCVILLREFNPLTTESGILLSSLLFCGLTAFFCVTKAGNRVLNKDKELKEALTSFSRLFIQGEQSEKEILWYSLMTTEIRETHLQVLGGNMFVICDSLILSVTGSLITYGVLIFQMD